MIKELYIVRHGKSTRDYESTSDIDRPLKERGIIDAYTMSERLLNKNQIPELIISSNAIRALHTATIFARTFNLNPLQIVINGNLYLTNPKTVIDIISDTINDINSLMIFGHNPTFTNLANYYLKDKIDNMPTTGIAGFKFNINTWADIKKSLPIESFFDYPKNII